MSLDLGELVMRARMDTSGIRKGLDETVSLTRRALSDLDEVFARAGDKAGKSGGKAISEGVADGAKTASRGVDQAAGQWEGSTKRAGQRAGQAGGQALADGVRVSAGDAADAVGKATDGWKSDAERAGQRAGEAAGDGLADGAKRGATGLGDAVKGEARGMVAPAKAAGEDAGEAAGEGILSRIRDKAGSIKDAISDTLSGSGGPIAAIGLGVGATLMKGIAGAMEQKSINATLAAQLGLTKQQSEQAGKAAGSLFGQGYGSGMEDISEAIQTVIQNIDGMKNASADSLQSVAGDALTLSQVFGQDLEGSTAAVSQMLRTGLAKNAQEAFDVLTVGFQNGTNKADDLLDTFGEYSTQFRKLGLDAKDATGLMSQGLKGGARDADIVADALKELSIRAVDGSETTAAGFKAIGLNVSDMTAKFAAGGSTARSALGEVLKGLSKIPDPAMRSQAAVALFGTQAEDLGNALYSLDLDTAAKDLGSVAGATDRANKAFNDTPQAKMETFFRSVQQGATNVIGGLLVPMLNTASDTFSGVFNLVGEGVGLFKQLPGPVQSAALAVGALTAAQKLFGDRIDSGKAKLAGWTGSIREYVTAQQAAGSQTGRFALAVQGLAQKSSAISSMQAAFRNAADQAERFPKSAGTFAAATSGMKSAAGGLLSVLGGPWGVAIAGATLTLGLWAKKNEEAAQREAQHQQYLGQLKDTLNQTTGAITDSTKALVVKEAQDKGWIKTAKEFGISGDLVIGTMMGQKDKASDLGTQLDALSQAYQNQIDASHTGGLAAAQYGGSVTGLASNAVDAKKRIDEFRSAILGSAGDVASQQAAWKEAQRLIKGTDGASQDYKAALDRLQTAQGGVTTANTALAGSLQAVTNKFLAGRSATRDWKQALEDAKKQAQGNWKAGVGDDSETSRANQTAIDNVTGTGIKGLSDLVEQAKTDTSVTGAQIKAKYDEMVAGMYRTLAAFHVTGKAADAYVKNALGSIPSEVSTRVKADITAAKAKLDVARIAVQNLGVDFDNLPVEIQTQIVADPSKATALLNKYHITIDGVPKDLYTLTNTNAPTSQKKLQALSVAAIDANAKVVSIPVQTPQAQTALQGLLKISGAAVTADGKSVVIPSSVPLSADTIQKLKNISGVAVSADGKTVTVSTSAPGAPNAYATLASIFNLPSYKSITVGVQAKLNRDAAQLGAKALFNERGGMYLPGGVRAFAAGGFAERVPQIGGGNHPILWNEGTAKEAFISWDPRFRARSVQIMSRTANEFGYQIIPTGSSTGATYTAPAAASVAGAGRLHPDDVKAIAVAVQAGAREGTKAGAEVGISGRDSRQGQRAHIASKVGGAV